MRGRLLAALGPPALLGICAATSAAAPAPSEAQIRGRIVAAAHQAANAKSLTARGVAELRGEGGGLVPIYRLEVRIDKGGPLKTEDRRFPADRWTKQPQNTVVTVGKAIWWREGTGKFSEGTIDPGLADGTTGELKALERAAKNGHDLKQVGPGRYEVEAAAFDSENGAGPIRLVATLTAAGELKRLRRIEGTSESVVVAETFRDFGRPLGVAAPPEAEIAPGPPRHVTNSDEFTELLGPGPFDE